MNEIILPPSPSWYLSTVITASDDGRLIAYGTKNEVVILEILGLGIKRSFKPYFIPFAHKGKVNSLSFGPQNSSFSHHVVSAADDGAVNVWDANDLTLLYTHSHLDDHKAVAVDWSRADLNLVVSASDLGSVVAWDLQSNTIRRLVLGGGKLSPITLACSPHDKDVVAIGAKAGLIVLFNIKGEGHKIFRIRGHESDVISLAWCPVPENVFKMKNESGPEQVHLLASGSKDKSIYFWRTATDGRFEQVINLPNQTGSSIGYRNKNGVGGQGNCWVCLRWVEPSTLLASSQFGELLSLDLTVDKENKSKLFSLLHSSHLKGLFSIAAPQKLPVNSDYEVWTCALDKRIVGCQVDSKEVVADIPTIGGCVFCLAVSPFDPYRLAIGLGDNRILLWNMSNRSFNNVVSFWNKINCKVMALSWHPKKDNMLAFSTGEGRVGVIDVSSPNKPPILLRLHHRKSVYTLVWGNCILPVEEKKARRWEEVLFSVGDGDILQYDVEFPEREPLTLKGILAESDSIAVAGKRLGRSDIAWNHNRNLIAVGNDNGSIYITDSKLKHIHTVFAHKKLVQCIVWHPGTVTSGNSVSVAASWLASAADNIHVVSVTESGVENIATLTAHTERVVSLAWSPHFSMQLVSSSYDYTCIVWDVETGTILSCYDGHHNAVLCALPSSLHPNIIITGSYDSTLRLWDWVNYRPNGKTKTKKACLNHMASKLEKVEEATELIASEPPSTSVKPSDKEPKTSIEKRKAKSMFPVISQSLSGAKHVEVLWRRKNELITEKEELPPEEETSYLNFFGDHKAMRQLLLAESSHHKASGNHSAANHMALWTGDLAENLKEAVRKKQLNEWLVGLAPSVSYQLWRECCQAYAEQLVETGDHLRASSYYLAVHLVEEAIDTLLSGKLVREAVALAKSRFPPHDISVTKALEAWAAHCNSVGQLGLGAHALIDAGRNMSAVEMLSRSKDAKSLALGAQIATTTNTPDLAESLAVRSIHASLVSKNFEQGRKVLADYAALKPLSVWLDVHKLLVTKSPLSEGDIVGWIKGEPLSQKGLFQEALELPVDPEITYADLSRLLATTTPARDSDKVRLYISSQICLAVFAELSSKSDPSLSKTSLRHLIQALNSAYLCCPANLGIFLNLSIWLFPSGPFSTHPALEDGEILSLSTRLFLSAATIFHIDHLHLKLDDDLLKIVRKCSFLLLDKDILQYFNNCTEIKRLESMIVETKLNSGAHRPENGETDSCLLSEKLVQLKEHNTKFEGERIGTPNPAFIYSSIRNLLEGSQEGKVILSEVVDLWESFTSIGKEIKC